MAKLFTIAGTSILNNVRTYRFASGNIKTRVGVLKRNDHSDIQLFELPNPMDKPAAIQWLNSQGIDAVVPYTGRKKIEYTAEELAQMEEEHRLAIEQERIAEEAQLAKDAEWIDQLVA